MDVTAKDKLVSKAVELLEQLPDGLRYRDLKKKLSGIFPDIPLNTIGGYIPQFEILRPQEIQKPTRGHFIHTKYLAAKQVGATRGVKVDHKKFKEEDFYQAFADFLVEELEEVSRAIPVGGNKFKNKWGTPDVIGVLKKKPSDIFDFPPEIVSGEVKLDTQGLITAFGQACAYKLFSHKSYIVVPLDSFEEDISRLDSLSMIFGIGLVLFDTKDPKNPNFQVKVRATRQEPDMFYVNKHLRLVADDLLA